MAILQTEIELSIIIINYNTDELVLKLLSLLDNSHFELIVIDNSDKKTLEDQLNHYKNTRYFFMGENLGFARAANYGVSVANGKWIFFLNSDTQAQASEIEKLVEITKKNNAQVAAPALISNNHTENTVGSFDPLYKNLLNFLFLRPHFANCTKLIKPKYFDIVTAGALLIQKSVFERMGEFDRSFFMYFEDIDLSYRLYKNHIHILYVPEVKITHMGGASSTDTTVKSNLYKQSLHTYLQKNRGGFVASINRIIGFLK